MLSERDICAFDEDGYVRGGKVLDDDRLDTLRDELDRVIADAGPNPPGYRADKPPFITNLSGDAARPVWQIVNIWAASEPFRDLLSEPALTQSVAALTSAQTLRVWHDQIQYKPARDGGVNGWHQDAPLWMPLTPCGTDERGRPAQITAWIALDDADERNGCMTMVRGSHRWGDQLARVLNRRTLDLTAPDGRPLELVMRPVPAGYVHFHHALTWHSSHGNQSDRPRRAIAIHYMTDATRYRKRSGEHPIERFIDVGDGDLLAGELFPVVHDDPSRTNETLVVTP